MKILLVEDDEFIAKTLENILIEHHYVVDLAFEGELGWELIETFNYDLILLDVILPKLDGIEFCKRLRSQGNKTPVLLLTAKNSSTEKVIGLDAGADDYVVKPFEISELLARIRVLLRRQNSLTSTILQWGQLELNSSTHEVTYNQTALNVTPKEYRLLELFLRNGERVLTRGAILDRLWSVEEAPNENTVTAHVKDLRRKLKQVGAGADFIDTVYGVGYRLKTPSSTALNPVPPQQKSLKQQTKKALTKVWRKFQGLNQNRLAILDRAARAWQSNSLDTELLQQAQLSAHQLAGALGVFGFAEASSLALEIEQILQNKSTTESQLAQHFSQMLSTLKNSLNPVTTGLEMVAANSKRPIVFVIDNNLPLAEEILQRGVGDMRLKLTKNLADLEVALQDAVGDGIILNFSLREMSPKQWHILSQLVNRPLPLPILFFTDSDNLRDRLKVSQLSKCAFLKHSPLSARRIVNTIKTWEQAKKRVTKVMVVDDDQEILNLVRSILKPWAIKLTTLDNPQKFWQMIVKSNPDLLILDLAMPHITGLELCQLIRQDSRWCKLPILFFSVHSDLGTINQVLNAGANAHISKQQVHSELITKILTQLDRVNLLRTIATGE